MPEARDFSKVPLTINLHHGEGFKNTRPCTAMWVYVRANIKGQHEAQLRSRSKRTVKNVDKYNGANAVWDWNSEMRFSLDERKLLEQGRDQSMELVLKVMASSPLFLADKKLGEVRVPVRDLYNGVPPEEMVAWTSLWRPVVGHSKGHKGAVYFSYRFGSHGDEVDCGGCGVQHHRVGSPFAPRCFDVIGDFRGGSRGSGSRRVCIFLVNSFILIYYIS